MLAAREEANDCCDEESYDSEDSFDTSLSDDFDTCFVDGHDATMDDAYKDELYNIPEIHPNLNFRLLRCCVDCLTCLQCLLHQNNNR